MDEKKLKNQISMIKLVVGIIFGILIMYTIYKKPVLPPDVQKNFKNTNFKAYGGSGANQAWNVIETRDGNYLIMGDTTSLGAGMTDAYVIKVDTKGDLIWTRTFGGPLKDSAIAATWAKDGYIIVGGTASKGAGETDVYAIKIDEDGDLVWESTFGGENYDFAYSVVATRDGNYVTAGYTSSFADKKASDMYLVKFNDKGKRLWDRTYGGDKWNAAYSVKETRDGGLIMAGYTDSFGAGQSDFYVVKTDADGNCVWSRTYGGKRQDIATSIINTKDGGYLIAGKTTSYISKGVGWDMMFVKIDSEGNSKWSRVLPASETEVGECVVEDKDGYTAVGIKKCYGICDSNVYFIKLDADGNTVSYKLFAGLKDDLGKCIIKTSDANYLMTGTTLSQGNPRGNIFLLKVDKDGNQIF
jgi:hypothetical protein